MIYLCIPAHNEHQTVGVVLWKVRQVMAALERDYQLLVADDASTDRTPDVLEPYTRVLPLTVMRNAERRGYAASLEMLLREAVARSHYPKRDAIITLQADFTDDPAHVEKLVKRIESGADIVVTNATPAARTRRVDRWGQRLLTALLRRLTWPDDVRDPLNGFTAYRVLCVKRMLAERNGSRLVRHEGRAANAQLLHDAAPHARRVETVELEPRDRQRWRDSRAAFATALRQVVGLRQRREVEGLLPVSRLVPDEIVTGSNGHGSAFVEDLRQDRRGPRKPRSHGQRGRGRRTRARSDGAGAPTAEDTATDSKRRRDGKRSGGGGGKSGGAKQSTRPRTGASDGTVAEHDDADNSAAQGKTSRSRRSRRGGRRRRNNRRNGTGEPQARDSAPASEDQTQHNKRPPPLEPTTPGA